MPRSFRLTIRHSILHAVVVVFVLTVCNAGCEKRIREPGSFNRPIAPLEDPATTGAPVTSKDAADDS
ncbi:MAG: hypothetical protein AAGK78_02960 [Planctomycetota bacterium]